MDFDIGSNQYRKAESRIEIDGLPQISFEFNRRYSEMMIKGLIFDKHGTLAGKFSENSLSLNIRGEFEMRSDASSVQLLRRENEEVLLEVKFLDKDRVQIHKAKLYSGKGRLWEVSPTMWKIADTAHTGESVDCGGQAVQLQ